MNIVPNVSSTLSLRIDSQQIWVDISLFTDQSFRLCLNFENGLEPSFNCLSDILTQRKAEQNLILNFGGS
jgi:hypothetical protein